MTDLFGSEDVQPDSDKLKAARQKNRELAAVNKDLTAELALWRSYKLTPRAVEVGLVSAVLESDGFDTPGSMAKAVLKEAGNVLAMRDTYAIVVQFAGSKGLNFGPYSSMADARKAGDRLAGAAPYSVTTICSSGMLAAQEDGAVWDGFCATCQHRDWLHRDEGKTRGACGWTDCVKRCGKFVKLV